MNKFIFNSLLLSFCVCGGVWGSSDVKSNGSNISESRQEEANDYKGTYKKYKEYLGTLKELELLNIQIDVMNDNIASYEENGKRRQRKASDLYAENINLICTQFIQNNTAYIENCEQELDELNKQQQNDTPNDQIEEQIQKIEKEREECRSWIAAEEILKRLANECIENRKHNDEKLPLTENRENPDFLYIMDKIKEQINIILNKYSCDSIQEFEVICDTARRELHNINEKIRKVYIMLSRSNVKDLINPIIFDEIKQINGKIEEIGFRNNFANILVKYPRPGYFDNKDILNNLFSGFKYLSNNVVLDTLLRIQFDHYTPVAVKEFIEKTSQEAIYAYNQYSNLNYNTDKTELLIDNKIYHYLGQKNTTIQKMGIDLFDFLQETVTFLEEEPQKEQMSRIENITKDLYFHFQDTSFADLCLILAVQMEKLTNPNMVLHRICEYIFVKYMTDSKHLKDQFIYAGGADAIFQIRQGALGYILNWLSEDAWNKLYEGNPNAVEHLIPFVELFDRIKATKFYNNKDNENIQRIKDLISIFEQPEIEQPEIAQYRTRTSTRTLRSKDELSNEYNQQSSENLLLFDVNEENQNQSEESNSKSSIDSNDINFKTPTKTTDMIPTPQMNENKSDEIIYKESFSQPSNASKNSLRDSKNSLNISSKKNSYKKQSKNNHTPNSSLKAGDDPFS